MTLVPTRIKRTGEQAVDSRELILKAHAYLDVGKKYEASETAWEAVHYGLQAVADKRGWRYKKYDSFFHIAELLHAEFGGSESNVRLQITSLDGMHQDYMIESVPEFWIRRGINDADALLDFLDQVE